MAAHHRANFIDKKVSNVNVVLGYSAIFVYLMHGHSLLGQSPCCCAQLSSYAESEITNLVPQAPSSFPLFPLRAASDGKLGGSPQSRLYSFSRPTQCEWESPLPMITAKKQWRFLLRGHAHAYVAIMCTKLCTICYTSQRVHVATIEILFAKNCTTHEIWGLKFASEAIS